MKQYLIAFLGSMLLFVVVCPITPTPIAVLDGKAHASHAPALAIASIVAIAMPRLEQPFVRVLNEEAAPISTGKILELNCTRLC